MGVQRKIARDHYTLKAIAGNVLDQPREIRAVRLEGVHLSVGRRLSRGLYAENTDVGTDIIKDFPGLEFLRDPLDGAGFLGKHLEAAIEFPHRFAAKMISARSIGDLDAAHQALP